MKYVLPMCTCTVCHPCFWFFFLVTTRFTCTSLYFSRVMLINASETLVKKVNNFFLLKTTHFDFYKVEHFTFLQFPMQNLYFSLFN